MSSTSWRYDGESSAMHNLKTENGDDIVPIPGTKRVKYLEENVAATAVTLSETARSILEKALSSLPVSGERYTAEGMKGVNA